MKKYKILEPCKYSPDGIKSIDLNVGDEVELPDTIGIPFSIRGICELCKEIKVEPKKVIKEVKEEITEEAPVVDRAKTKKKKKK